MAATVVINDKTIMNNLRVVLGEYTLTGVADTIVTGLRSVHALFLTPGYAAMHTWYDSTIPTTSGTVNVRSSNASSTTGTYMAIGY